MQNGTSAQILVEQRLRSTATVNQNQQTEYGVKQDANVATIVTTADLRSLIPVPDDATLLRSTHASLRRCEQEATTLLKFVQRELASEMQESGVSFAPSALDKVADVTRKIRGSAAIQFSARQQLTYHGESGSKLQASTGLDNSRQQQQFAQNESKFRFYSDAMRRRANMLEKMRQEVEARHDTYDDVERGMAQLGMDPTDGDI